jgi:hypothetical protein
MRLSPDDIETAFVETVREQVNGEPFNWPKVAVKLNERLADMADMELRAPRPFILRSDP